MSRITVRRRGPAGQADRVTLGHLRPGETFRFPRSAPGTVYQMVGLSQRSIEDTGLDGFGAFDFVNLSTGLLSSAEDNRDVVPVDCSMTARDRV